jgi:hypothetical protein
VLPARRFFPQWSISHIVVLFVILDGSHIKAVHYVPVDDVEEIFDVFCTTVLVG